MEVGNEYVMLTVVDLIARHCERKRAAAFLLRRAEDAGNFPRANYYWALGTVGDPDSVPRLRRIYDEYAEELRGAKDRLLSNSAGYIDYLRLCATLRRLDGSPEFEAGMRDMLSHPDEMVRTSAERLLGEQGHDRGAGPHFRPER